MTTKTALEPSATPKELPSPKSEFLRDPRTSQSRTDVRNAAAVAPEVQDEIFPWQAVGRVNSMTLGPVQIQVSGPTGPSVAAKVGLDRRRLLRVLDYIEANLEGNLSLDRLASIACLSRYHFARAFKQAVGHSPHRYVSGRRLEHAKVLLMLDDQSLVDVALALDFSCQANFTRAFTRATGLTPGQFRNGFRSRQRDLLLGSLQWAERSAEAS